MLPEAKSNGAANHHHIRAPFAPSKRRTIKKFVAVLLLWSVWLVIRRQNRMLKDIASSLQTSSTFTADEERRGGGIGLSGKKVPNPADRSLLVDSSHASHSRASNSSLVIILGNLRGGEEAWKSLYKNVLDVNTADLALILGPANSTSNYHYPNSSLYTRAKYVWNFHEYDDWADAIDLINGTSWRETHLPYFTRKRTGLLGGVKGHLGSGAIIFMIRWFLSQHLLGNPDVLNQYDRFVITRADHYYQCQHDYNY